MQLISRRDILALVSGAATAWPLDVIAQAPQLPVIGFLSSGSPDAFQPFLEAYRQGMSKWGYVEDRNVRIIYHWANGDYDELGMQANDLVRRQVKLIAASGGLISAKAAMKATASIPILFVSGYDPVKLGLVASINRPGGKATGVALFTTELLPKQLELLDELGPRIRTVAILSNPASVTPDVDTEESMAAARQKGHQLHVLKASTAREIDAVFELAAEMQVSAVMVTADPFFNNRRDQIVKLAARHALLTIYPWREYVAAGGLMSYGTELTWAYHLIGEYAARILKGEKPDDLPVQRPTTFSLVINLNTANALGLTFPRTVLSRAEVIE